MAVSLPELLLLAVAVAMDSVAVSLALGMRLRRPPLRSSLLIAGTFGAFHVVMPLLGWLLSFGFADLVSSATPWIAFGLLALVGGHMIVESFSDDHHVERASIRLRTLLPLGVATSIDVGAVGVTFGILQVQVVPAALLIGGVVFALALTAVLLGARVGKHLGQWATLAGGVILIAIGARILLSQV